MGAPRNSYPRFRREGDAPPIELTDDDAAILRHIFRHRFVRADDLYRLFPLRTPDRLSRRLTLLYRNHYLDRPRAQIDRFQAGGSQALVYGLDLKGARFLKEKFGAPIGTANWKARNRSFKRENLDHTLAISKFMIDLELACRAHPNVSLISFEDILAAASQETREANNPGAWPVPVRFNGANATIQLIPDAIFGLRITREAHPPLVSYTFLEIDRGTMTIAPARTVQESDAFLYRATVLRKLVVYAESWGRNLHRSQYDIPAARMLILTTSKGRVSTMMKAAADLPRRVPLGLFLFGVLGCANNPLAMRITDVAGQATSLLLSPIETTSN